MIGRLAQGKTAGTRPTPDYNVRRRPADLSLFRHACGVSVRKVNRLPGQLETGMRWE